MKEADCFEAKVTTDCFLWGDQMRIGQSGWTGRSTLGRIMDEGAGAASEGYGAKVPIKDIRKDLQYVYEAYHRLREIMPAKSHAMFVAFVPRASVQQRAAALGVSQPRYYQIRKELVHFVMGYAK